MEKLTLFARNEFRGDANIRHAKPAKAERPSNL